MEENFERLRFGSFDCIGHNYSAITSLSEQRGIGMGGMIPVGVVAMEFDCIFVVGFGHNFDNCCHWGHFDHNSDHWTYPRAPQRYYFVHNFDSGSFSLETVAVVVVVVVVAVVVGIADFVVNVVNREVWVR